MLSASRIARRALSVATLAALVATFASMAASAQDSSDLNLRFTAADKAAARLATGRNHHATSRYLPGATAAPRTLLSTVHRSAAAVAATGAAHSSAPPATRYPADVTYQGGAVVESAESHAVYMLPNGHCEISSCWGNPEGFLRDLARSDFVHVLDQYAGRTDNNRYTVGRRARVRFTPSGVPLTDNDILAAVHAVASRTGETGYGHIYHVFLPSGTDECFDSSFSVCYSPDNPNTWFFCAYHGSADFSDVGHVLYSVEPYQNVPGCSDPPGTPNGQLVDSTNDVLSHELFETISDPDGDGWWNATPSVTGLQGEEIGDECVFIVPPSFGDPSVFTIGRKVYAVQLEYSNAHHGCAGTPQTD
jgi:hypothetical protein